MTENYQEDNPILLQLHIPKTAGSTFKKLLNRQLFGGAKNGEPDRSTDPAIQIYEGVYYYPRGLEENHPKISQGASDSEVPEEVRKVLRRPDLRAVLGHFGFGIHRHIPRNSVYMTILRDPVDRVLSLYYHIRRWPRSPLQKHIASEDMTIEQFVAESGFKQADNGQTRRLAGSEPAFGECSQALLEQAKQNIRESFQLVGLSERFDETVILAKRLFNWRNDIRYVPRLVNDRRPRKESVPESVLSFVRDRNALDIALYDYAEELLRRRLSSQPEDFWVEQQGFSATNSEYAERLMAESNAMWGGR